MPRLKLTKTVAENALPGGRDYELRDTVVPGFLLKVTPAGRRVFMVHYRTQSGQRRKPAIGRLGELTVEQARAIAKDILADARRHQDPSRARRALRAAPTLREFARRFMDDYCIPKNRPSTTVGYERLLNGQILPRLGHMKVPEITRPDIAEFMAAMKRTPTNANRALACLSKMFNLAEVWGVRPDGTNPCRQVPRYPERRRNRLITDDELARIFAYLDRADAEGLESPFITLGVRLQFAFAARMSEITRLEWSWIDFSGGYVRWPDSKTGGMTKPLSSFAAELLRRAPRVEGSRYVLPSAWRADAAMQNDAYYQGWTRILQAAQVPHTGTHAIRHRSATDIANSGIPLKVGMQLTAHKTVSQFMQYVHVEDRAVREAAELVARRQAQVTRRELTPSLDAVRSFPPMR